MIKKFENFKNSNELRIYESEKNMYEKYAILLEDNKYITLFDQGDESFWFMEDESEHPLIDVDEWFSSEEDAINYIEKYIGCKLVFIGSKLTDLKWN